MLTPSQNFNTTTCIYRLHKALSVFYLDAGSRVVVDNRVMIITNCVQIGVLIKTIKNYSLMVFSTTHCHQKHLFPIIYQLPQCATDAAI